MLEGDSADIEVELDAVDTRSVDRGGFGALVVQRSVHHRIGRAVVALRADERKALAGFELLIEGKLAVAGLAADTGILKIAAALGGFAREEQLVRNHIEAQQTRQFQPAGRRNHRRGIHAPARHDRPVDGSVSPDVDARGIGDAVDLLVDNIHAGRRTGVTTVNDLAAGLAEEDHLVMGKLSVGSQRRLPRKTERRRRSALQLHVIVVGRQQQRLHRSDASGLVLQVFRAGDARKDEGRHQYVQYLFHCFRYFFD